MASTAAPPATWVPRAQPTALFHGPHWHFSAWTGSPSKPTFLHRERAVHGTKHVGNALERGLDHTLVALQRGWTCKQVTTDYSSAH